MSIRTSQKAELFAGTLRKLSLGLFAVFVTLFCLSIIFSVQTDAAASSNINFQARLENATGSIASDGTYNVEFKLYNTSAPAGGHTEDQGACTYNGGTTDPNCLWYEDYLVSASQGVRVVNGYLTVNLGSITAFPTTINWSQQLWLTMRIGGTGSSPTWDTEMSPRLLLTATPYSFQSAQLSVTNSGYAGTLSFATTLTGTDTITIPDTAGAGGTVCLQGSTGCGFAASTGATGYIQNQNASVQTTANYKISGTGQAAAFDASTATTLNIGTSTATAVNIGETVSTSTVTVNSALDVVGVMPITGAAPTVLSVTGGTGNVHSAGGAIQLTAGAGGTSGVGSGGVGGNITLVGGTGGVGAVSSATGGSIILQPGVAGGGYSSPNGSVIILPNSYTSGGTVYGNSTTTFQIQNASASPTTFFDADSANQRIGINTTAPGSIFTIAAPATPGSSTFAGTSATTILSVTGGNGGATSGTAGYTAGAGAGLSLQGGNGGNATGSTGTSIAGSGGSFTIQAGNGGVNSNSSGTNGNGGSITLSAGAVGTGGVNGSNGSVIVNNQANSTTAFEIQNTSGYNVLDVDTSNNQVVLGKLGASGLNGTIVFNSATAGNYTTTLQASSSQTATYSLTLPTALPGSTQCLQSTSGGVLSFTSCGGGGITWPLSYTSDEAFQPNSISNNSLDLHNNSSAINGIQITGTATTVAPIISAVGGDTNIGITLQAKGTGTLLLDTSGAGTVNLGLTATGINLGTSSGVADTIGVGSSDASTAVTLQGGSSQLVINNSASTFSNNVVVGTNQVQGSGSDYIQLNSASGYTLYNGNNGWGVNVTADYLRLNGGGLGYENLQFSTDTNISRAAAGKLYVGNGTNGDYSGTLVAGFIGIGATSPSSLLTITGSQPASSSGAGTAATTALTITGGTGGNTTGGSNTAGAGGGISLQGGNGGNATTGTSTSGAGGSFTIQAGNGGTAGASGTNGNGGNITLSAGAVGSGGSNGSNGSVIVKNQANSTMAFQIQNAAGSATLFSEDTINGITTAEGTNSIASVGSTNLLSSCSGTNWSGSGTGPYVHTSGSTANLTCTLSSGPTAGAVYQITYKIAGTAGISESLLVGIGGVTANASSGNVTGQQVVLTPTSTSSLFFGDSLSSSTATISNMSVYLVTPANNVLAVKNSDGSAGLELRSGGSGLYNSFVGVTAGEADTTGYQNSALGYQAVQNNTTGYAITGVGYQALQDVSTGLDDTAVGSQSQANNVAGSFDTSLGTQALDGQGGSGNTAVGAFALNSGNYGTYVTALGYSTSVGAGLQNATAIGAGSIVSQSDSLILGTTNGTYLSGTDIQTSVGIGTSTPGSVLTVTGLQPASGNAESVLNVTGGTGAGTATAGNGAGINLQSGNGGNGSTANGNGGNITLSAGSAGSGAGSAGTAGSVIIENQSNSTTAFQIQNASGVTVLATDTTANTVDLSGTLNFTPQVTAPSSVPAAADGGLVGSGLPAGTYWYVYSYVTAAGVTSYSPVSTPSGGVTVALNHQINLSSIGVSSSNLVTARRIYRGTSSTGPFFFVGNLSNNTGSTYTDNSPSSGPGFASVINQTTNLDLGGSPILIVDTTGFNTSVGNLTLANDSTGTSNTAFGNQALQDDTTGSSNVGIGPKALQDVTTGGNNTAVGKQALSSNVSSSNDTALGFQSGLNITAGNDTFIGYNAGYQDSGGHFITGATLQNAVAIGTYAQVQAANSLVLGSVDTTTNVGIGTTIPLNTFSVSPMIYNTGTACSVASSGSGTCTGTATTFLFGSGTTWTSSMNGDELIFADGQEAIISSVTSTTAITLKTALPTGEASGSFYRIHSIGLQVTSSGNVYVQNTSTTGFQIQNSASTPSQIFGVDTSGNNVMIGQANTAAQLVVYDGSNSNTVTLEAGTTSSSYTVVLPTAAATTGECLLAGTVGSNVPLTWGTCAVVTSRKVVLTPEYAGAVLDNNGSSSDVGTMISGYDSTQKENYYQWTTSQSTNQLYSIVVQIPVPADFSSWASSTPIKVDIKTSDTTNGTVVATLLDTTGATESSWNTCSLTPGSTSWTTVTGCTVAGTYTANGVMTLRLIMQAPTSGTTEVGDIVLSYNSAY
jgi:hypothetical protein